MNRTTRARFTVLLAMYAVAFGGRIVLADAVGDFNKRFGAEARKVAVGKIPADNAKFANKLLPPPRQRKRRSRVLNLLICGYRQID